MAGRRAVAAVPGPPDVSAHVADALLAHSQQEVRTKTDPLGRTWLFRHENVRGHVHLLIRVSKGLEVWDRLILCSVFRPDTAEEAIIALDAASK